MKDWIQSGALKNVNQIALELHVVQKKANERWYSNRVNVKINKIHFRQYIELLEILKDLYKLGFVLISHEVNMVWGPRDPDGLYDLVEVVFMKQW